MIRYIRFLSDSGPAYGRLDGETVVELAGGLFEHRETGRSHKLAGVKLLYPCDPPKVLAVGRNYHSHLGTRTAPSRPEIFYKPVSCLQNPGDPIALPPESANVHYEGEVVVVVGRRLRNASKEEAAEAIFGVTCGNDVSERNWQNGEGKDLQWWRAKGSDTFGPLGPVIVTGLDHANLMLQTRLNGETVQRQSTADLMFDCPTILSFISRYVTLAPGDVVYTGTPGSTRAMKAGDTVEVEVEGVGTLTNPVVAA